MCVYLDSFKGDWGCFEGVGLIQSRFRALLLFGVYIRALRCHPSKPKAPYSCIV